MIQLEQIKVSVEIENQTEEIKKTASKKLKIDPEDISKVIIRKRSIDARRKPDVYFLYTIDVELVSGKRPRHYRGRQRTKARYQIPVSSVKTESRPLVVGFGPAGMFAAYILALAGANPVVIERGQDVKKRIEDVRAFHATGVLNESSNVQFGEGGAGTFSDGKLVTQKNDHSGRMDFILKTFYDFGADSSVLTEARPHVGTDRLVEVVSNLRKKIISLGGDVRFASCMDGLVIESGRIVGAGISGQDDIVTDRIILAIGHSARDTFLALRQQGIEMTAKPFAVGFRVEHPQKLISEAQYGKRASRILPPANYRLSARNDSLALYSFCMCPGGYVIDASSEAGRLCVNGMSNFGRDSQNANSAMVMPVDGRFFDMKDPLSGMYFQRDLEEKAYSLGNGAIPQQLWQDYISDKKSTSYGRFGSKIKGRAAFANLRRIISDEWDDMFISGMNMIREKMPEFWDEEMILSGIESRTSSPVRILRDEEMKGSIQGLYPCGEGAGYAGGIISAAMDGMKAAEAVLRSYGHGD